MTKAKSFEIPKRLVWEAYKRVKANRGAVGVNEQSLKEFEESLGDHLYRIWNRMSSGSYFPPPVKLGFAVCKLTNSRKRASAAGSQNERDSACVYKI